MGQLSRQPPRVQLLFLHNKSLKMTSVKNLPKVDATLKGQLEGFSTDKLKHAETTEKTSLPSKEEFVKVKEEKQQHNDSIKEFSKDNLKHANTTEKLVLPSKEDIEGEKKEQDLRKSVEGFDASKLKNCETV